jgi:hypothetical protein
MPSSAGAKHDANRTRAGKRADSSRFKSITPRGKRQGTSVEKSCGRKLLILRPKAKERKGPFAGDSATIHLTNRWTAFYATASMAVLPQRDQGPISLRRGPMVDRGSSRVLKISAWASILLVLVLMACTGVLDDLFLSLSSFVQDLLHDLNHQ